MYASVIVDLSAEKLDRIFQYEIPPEMEQTIRPGMPVEIGFGRGDRLTTGYVVDITEEAEIDKALIKPLRGPAKSGVSADGELLALAAFLKRYYGGTMISAIKTVMPVQRSIRQQKKRTVRLLLSGGELDTLIEVSHNRGHGVKERVLLSLKDQREVDERVLITKLGASRALINSLKKQGIIEIEESVSLRDPMENMLLLSGKRETPALNGEQLGIVEDIESDREHFHLIRGVTGSGKTLIYMELAARAIDRGEKTIILIPEIALTFQTLVRFYSRFGDRVCIMHSRLSDGERYDQFERARTGEADIMIGPRSALFTPFENLGYIIIDEEQESSYKSETVPRYHTREAAFERGRLSKATVVLGSATPSVDAYYLASSGKLKLHELSSRANKALLPTVHVVDLREELKSGNRTMLSRALMEAISDRLKKHEQVMLFLNRRGMSGVVSCRSCGNAVKCPHCDVSLTLHSDGIMRCHYCGYERERIRLCECCGSDLIGTFRSGTQRVEQYVRSCFPGARILRMDHDTTRLKDSYENILYAFGEHEADILIGTQMIVKGHDFPLVTLVGILAADMSLGVPDYTSEERTFSLLTQAAGRAGRGSKKGEVYIQTYQPENYAVTTAASQDYISFYNREIEYRTLMEYPPIKHMLLIFVASEDEKAADVLSGFLAVYIRENIGNTSSPPVVIGPSQASVYRVNDVYRRQLYVKHESRDFLADIKDCVEALLRDAGSKASLLYRKCSVVFDLL